MSGQLSRLAIIGCAKEPSPNTYTTPTFYIPFSKGDIEDMIAQIKDETFRANDTVLQGMYAGPTDAVWSIDTLGYPDIVGHFLRGIIGPDTVTAGVSTTVGTGGSTIGATSLPSTASIPANSYINIGTGATQEYAYTTAVTGSGPYTLTVTTVFGQSVGLTKAHSAGDALVAQTKHVFAQNPTAAKATYSFTLYDTSETVSYAGATMSELQLKIDPKAALSAALKYSAFPYATASAMTPTFTALDPILGWEWSHINAGGSSTRGLTYDATVKRAVDVVHSSDGIQAPREIFQGGLEYDGAYKAIYENQTDLNEYLNYVQRATTATLQAPVARGGSSLAITTSKGGYFKGKRDFASVYVQADFSLSGIYNATDGGAVQATLMNFVTTAY